MNRNFKPRKILFVQHGSTIMGGLERLLLNIVHSYRERGIESIVALPEQGELVDRLREIDIKTRIVPSCLFPGKNEQGLNQYLGGTYERTNALVQIIQQEEIDIVHTHTAYPFDGALAAIKAGIPHVWHMHSIFDKDTLPTLFNAYPLSQQNLKTLYSQLADVIVGVSSPALQFFQQKHHCRFQVIPNGLDIEHFDRQSAIGKTDIRAMLDLKPKTTLVAFIGRISFQKDPLTFIKAAAEILKIKPDTHFIILGPAHQEDLKQEMDAAINKTAFAENFHLLGQREDIPVLLPQFDVFLLTSIFEGQGLVCLESLAARCPLVSTRSGGPEDIIIDGVSGFLTEIGDFRALAKKTLAILDDANLANALKTAGRKRVEDHFSWEQFINQFINLYSELLKDFDPERKADPTLELCFHLIVKNSEMALQMKAHEERLAELEGFFDRLQNTSIYRIAKGFYKVAGGKTRQ